MLRGHVHDRHIIYEGFKMKRKLLLSIVLILLISDTGCAAFGRLFYHEPHEITSRDAKRIHPFSQLSDRHKRLTAQQRQLINKIFGQDISREEDLIAYFEAKRRKGIYGDPGNIFLVHAGGESGSLEILVCTTHGRVDEIVIKNNPVVEGRAVIPDEFLQQFIGRTLQDSWKVAQTASDLVDLPAKIRPLAGDTRTSEEVAKAIRKILVWTEVLQIR
jgi:hypothetical protein